LRVVRNTQPKLFLRLAPLAETDECQIMPRDFKMKPKTNQFLDFLHSTVFEIVGLASLPANQMVMVLAIVIGSDGWAKGSNRSNN
jgi:hypothetical protein